MIVVLIAVYFITKDKPTTTTPSGASSTSSSGLDVSGVGGLLTGLFGKSSNKKKLAQAQDDCMNEFGGVNYDPESLDICMAQVKAKYS